MDVEPTDGGEFDAGPPPDTDALVEAPAGVEAPAAPLALYRRYRPDTFADLIGQDHVTEPLQRALQNNRVNHAYLFSGPRGCGKTTSARILARALNCAKGPTPTPCGECDSCRDLARGGPGSIDVIEIDAASHGGVDDARDLRERAFFAPVQSRYKIYIVDEAHMVTPAGFNALLKLVEEPPPHVKFVFATTEPDKVIGTIRSRTHHYPFRLVPPKVLGNYLATLCRAEGVEVEEAVLPLVVRAGAGSVRDSLSVLDQLLGGADEDGVSYGQAAALLGYTPDSLLDEVLDAFAAGDSAGVFAAVDKVIEVGQDPKRFAEDLLRRLRDLIIVAAVPDAVTTGLVDVAVDQAERLQAQAAALGPGELTRAAEVIADGLTEMRGTTAPRLHLELMCSRVLLPEADLDGRGLHARIDRIERRMGMNGVTDGAAPPAAAPAPDGRTAARAAARSEATPADVPTVAHGAEADRPGRSADSAPPAPQVPQPPAPPAAATQESPQPPESRPTAATGGLGTADVRRLWPEVLEAVKSRRRYTWILLSQNSHVVDVAGDKLTLGLANAGARDNYAKGGSEDVLAESLIEVLGTQFTIQAIVDGSGGEPGRGRSGGGGAPRSPGPDRGAGDGGAAPQPSRSGSGRPAAPGDPGGPGLPDNPVPQRGPGPAAGPPAAQSYAAPDSQRVSPVATATPAERDATPYGSPSVPPQSDEPPHDPWDEPGGAPPPEYAPSEPAPSGPAAGAAESRKSSLRESIRPTRHQGRAAAEPEQAEEVIDRDDDVLDDRIESHTELLARHLGAEIIEPDEPA